MASPTKGGARAGAGRPLGSRNRVSAETQQKITSFVDANLDAYLGRLHNLAVDPNTKAPDAIRAIQVLFERAYGKEVTPISAEGPSPLTVAELLGMKSTAQDASAEGD